jgi:hypothetical protein
MSAYEVNYGSHIQEQNLLATNTSSQNSIQQANQQFFGTEETDTNKTTILNVSGIIAAIFLILCFLIYLWIILTIFALFSSSPSKGLFISQNIFGCINVILILAVAVLGFIPPMVRDTQKVKQILFLQLILFAVLIILEIIRICLISALEFSSPLPTGIAFSGFIAGFLVISDLALLFLCWGPCAIFTLYRYYRVKATA